MTANELRRRFPRAPESFIKANAEADYPAQGSKPECAIRDEPVEPSPREDCHTTRITLCVVSFRKRLTDPDNCTPKYFIDGLRYAGLIPDDRAEDIDLKVSQVKVKTTAQERTEITIL